MNEKEKIRLSGKQNQRLKVMLLFCILAAGSLFVWWTIARADREMRAGLLQQTKLVAQAVNIESLRALSGTEADIRSPDYLQLKKQLAAIRSANLQCRFIYLLGRRADGSVFFFVDSEQADSKDYSPPGQIYEEASAEYRRAFSDGIPAVEGPVADRWGMWVSGVVPLTDPGSGAVIAVLGMDIDARTWKWDVASRAALPAGLLLVLCIGLAAFFIADRRVDASPRPVLRRLLIPLTATVIVLAAGAVAFVWQQYQQQIARNVASHLSGINFALRISLNQQASGLAATAQPIIASATVHKALREGNADSLLADWLPVYEMLHRENHLTHFYFFDSNRICVLRVHKPEKRGDRIDRFTALEAERTGKAASGIELGPLGTFTLRVVQPVFDGGRLIGYVELGKEIEDVLEGLHARLGIQLAVVIRKEHLNRQSWEAGMRMLGRQADWDRLARSALIYASQGRLPDAFATWADQAEHTHAETNREIDYDGKHWRVSATPMKDASDKDVGDLLIMHDSSLEKEAFVRLMALGGTAGTVLLVLLLCFIYVLLRRTDAGIRAQQAELSKRANTLQESEARMRAITDSARDAIMMMDYQGLISFWNPGAEMMLGYSSAEATGRDLHELIAPGRYHEAYHEAFLLFQSTGSGSAVGKTLKLNALRKDQSEVVMTLALSSIRINDQWHSVGIMRDETEREQAEAALVETKNQLERIIQTSLDPIVVTDSKGTITKCNRAFFSLLGYSEADVMGHHIIEFSPREHGCFQLTTGETAEIDAAFFEHSTEMITRLWQDGLVSHWESYLRHKDGLLIPVDENTVLAFNEQGEALEAIAIIRDITAQKRAEAAIMKTNRELEAATINANELRMQAELANAAKSEFLANMSHEIRTPMNGVIGMTGLLLETGLTEEQRRYADIVRSSGDALLGLINDILDFSKIEARKFELEIIDFDLRTTLEDIAELLEVKAREKGLELLCMIAPGVPSHLKGDPGRLRQIIINLTGNAVKFTHKGEIVIRAGVQTEDADTCELQFEITDTGIGIPEDKISLLFSPFTQVDGSTTRKYGGTGLGLSISKQLAELMGGRIGIRSQEGKGSTFWFTAVFEKQPAAQIPAPASFAELAGVRVLVVDDNDTNRLLVTTLLKGWGCRFAEASGGEEALERLREAFREGDPYQVALLDMLMPGMDGADLGRRIKESTEINDTRLIMITSLAARGEARRLEEIGFSGYLPKPVRQAQLHECLALVLGSKKAAKATDAHSLVTRHTVSEAHKGRVRILLAEDNITNQIVAIEILKKFGYRADAVANGKEAVKALKLIPYDLVLMDCQMPEMDGYEATREIRNWECEMRNEKQTELRTPIIAMTANAMKGDRELCLEAGMNDYLAKPVNPSDLAEMLVRWLPEGEEQGSKFKVEGSRIEEQGSKFKVEGLRREEQGSKFKAEGSRIEEQGSKFKVEGSRREEQNAGSALEVNDSSAVISNVAAAEREILSRNTQISPAGRNDNALEEKGAVIFDRPVFLARLMGDEELAATITKAFFEDMPVQIEILASAVKAEDAGQAGKQAHKIKGAAANVGGEALRETALAMEKAGKAGDLEALRTLLPEMEKRFDKLKDAMTGAGKG